MVPKYEDYHRYMTSPPPEEDPQERLFREMKRMAALENRVPAPKVVVPPPPPVPLVTKANADDRQAIALYVVAARDFVDFLDMLREPESTPEALRLLRAMCETANPNHTTDTVELNKLIVSVLDRKAAPPKTAYDRLMSDDD